MKPDSEFDFDLQPKEENTALKIAVVCVVGYLLYIILTAPNDFMPEGTYLLLLPSAVIFTLLYIVQRIRGDAQDKQDKLKEAAKGFWLGLILCFLVDFCVNLPYTFMEMVHNAFR